MPSTPDAGPALDGIADSLVEVLRGDFAGTPLWGVKDPRHCRLLPLWSRVFETLDATPVYLLMVRNPLEVARSLERRDGIQLNTGLLLWLRHMVEAERDTRGRPRAIIRYDALLADWTDALAGVDAALGIEWTASVEEIADEVSEFLDPSLQHHRTPDSAVADYASLSAWVRYVFAALTASGPTASPELPAVVDRVIAEMDLADALYEPAL